ncbi:MAG: hypothetical protein ABIJ65_00405 [Chloroflexota bacterium]
MKGVRLLRRAVFVINRECKIVYSAYIPELGVEPDYDTIIGPAKNAL